MLSDGIIHSDNLKDFTFYIFANLQDKQSKKAVATEDHVKTVEENDYADLYHYY